MNADEIRARIETSRQELVDLVDGFDDAALSAPRRDGWAVKDHLVHVAAWEHWLLALFEHRDRMEAMGIGGVKTREIDVVNEAVFKLRRNDSAQQAKQYFRDAHQQLMAVLNKQTAEDFERPYATFFTGAAEGEGAEQPVLEAVAGNTYDHYPEHAGWIKEQLDSPGRA